MKLTEIADQLIAHAINCYAKGDDMIAPIIHAETLDGETFVGASVWGSDEEKDKTLRTIRQIFKARNIERYVLMSEAWMAWYNPGEIVGSNWPERRPREREDRVEVINIVGADRDGNTLHRSYAIERDDNGRPYVGAKLPEIEGYKTGTMTELLSC